MSQNFRYVTMTILSYLICLGFITNTNCSLQVTIASTTFWNNRFELLPQRTGPSLALNSDPIAYDLDNLPTDPLRQVIDENNIVSKQYPPI